jgi:hypothetical protein
MTDIPAFNRSEAEQEVDKFMMDYEMCNMYIQYGKEVEKNPDFVVPGAGEKQGEGLFSFQTVIYLYLAYVAYTTIPNIFLNWVAKQEAAGTWAGTNIPAIDSWIQESKEAAIAAAQKAAEVAADVAAVPAGDTVQAATDAVSSIQ